MKQIILILLTCSISLIAANKKIMEVVDIPFKEASMLKGYTEFMDISIYAKTVDEDTQESYFDEELEDDGTYPVLVYITNDSRKKVVVYAKDSTLNGLAQTNLREIITPYQSGVLTSKAVFATLFNVTSLGMRMADGGDKMADGHAQAHVEEIRNEFYSKTLKQTLLYPGDTIVGFMFFDAKKVNKDGSINMKMQFMDSLEKYDIKTKVHKK
ncbi:MAG: hypothetical protein GQ474_03910 [Sulfurimonas sp.]|nr:hypothetical protein [Sulfurimonas sp.]